MDADEISRRLATLPGWRVHDGKLRRELAFPDFRRAFAFLTSVALAAEAADHHPDWSNSYGRVVIDLVSHDVGRITERDLRLAATIEALVPADAR